MTNANATAYGEAGLATAGLLSDFLDDQQKADKEAQDKAAERITNGGFLPGFYQDAIANATASAEPDTQPPPDYGPVGPIGPQGPGPLPPASQPNINEAITMGQPNGPYRSLDYAPSPLPPGVAGPPNPYAGLGLGDRPVSEFQNVGQGAYPDANRPGTLIVPVLGPFGLLSAGISAGLGVLGAAPLPLNPAGLGRSFVENAAGYGGQFKGNQVGEEAGIPSVAGFNPAGLVGGALAGGAPSLLERGLRPQMAGMVQSNIPAAQMRAELKAAGINEIQVNGKPVPVDKAGRGAIQTAYQKQITGIPEARGFPEPPPEPLASPSEGWQPSGRVPQIPLDGTPPMEPGLPPGPPGELPPGPPEFPSGRRPPPSGSEPPAAGGFHYPHLNVLDTLGRELVGLIGAAQTIATSFDVSGIARQAAFMAYANPKQWTSGVTKGLKAFVSDKAAKAADAAIKGDYWYSHPTGLRKGLGAADGPRPLHIYEYGAGVSPGERVPGRTGINDSYISRAVNVVPGIKNSERSLATMLNVEGMDTYHKVANAMTTAGTFDERMAQGLRDVINHGRGYGDWNPGQIIPGLNALFSGRNLTAWAQKIVDPLVQPGALIQGTGRGRALPGFADSPRGLAAKNLASFISGNMALLGFLGTTGSLAGGAWGVSFDPKAGDWGKVRVGDTTFDIWGGSGSIVRLIVRGATGKGVSRTGTEYDTNMGNELVSFFRNKESPFAQKLTEALTGQNAIGQPVHPSPEWLAAAYLPFISQDVVDAYRTTQGSTLAKGGMAAGAGIGSAIGLGIQSYTTPTEHRQRAVAADIKAGALPATYLDAKGEEQPLKDRNQLTTLQKQAFDAAHPDIVKQRDETASPATRAIQDIRDNAAAQLQAIAPDLKTDPGTWRDERSRILTEERTGIDATVAAAVKAGDDFYKNNQPPVTRLDALNKAYNVVIEANKNDRGNIDWQAVDRVTAQWPERDRQIWEEQRSAKAITSEEKGYIAAQRLLDPYFRQRDQEWSQVQQAYPVFSQYKSYDDLRQSRIADLTKQGYSNSEAGVFVDQALAALPAIQHAASVNYLNQHRELIPILDKYGYAVPAQLRAFAR